MNSHYHIDNPTLYTSGYLVANPKGYTKHYYAGSERISSAIGLGGLANINDPLSIEKYENWKIKAGSLKDEMSRTINECLKNEYDIKNSFEFLHGMEEAAAGTMDRYFYHPDHLGSSSWITDGKGYAIQHLHYLPFGEDWVDQRNASWNAPYTFSGKEKDVETGYSYFGARYYDSGLSIWLSVDPMSDKYPNLTPYAYCANNPVILVDPDGRDWYEAEDGKITWTNYTSQKDLDDNKIKGTYLGQAHVVFDGSRWEKPSIRNGKKYITGEGAINASVTVYGPKGADDIHNFTGYTMTSDPEKFIPIDEGLYSLNYMNPGKGGPLSSHWAVNGTGIVPTMDGMLNKNPDAKGDWNFNTPWKTGIYVHSTNSNGGLGLSVSTGCLLILDSQWNDFNDVMQGVKRSSVRVTRTDFQVAPLKGVTGIIPYKYIIQKIKRR
jgi:RHS repeat-associated protein